MGLEVVDPEEISRWVDLSYHDLLKRRVFAPKDSSVDFYARLMCAYYQNEPYKLDTIQNKLLLAENLKDKALLILVTEFRKNMLDISIDQKQAQALVEAGESASWSGDIYFCAALGMYKISDYVLAKDLFINAYKRLKNQGATRKALLAKQNAITMQGNITCENRHIRDYFSLIEEAKLVCAVDVIGNAYLNISDEFYKVGAFNSAYRFINEGLKALKGHSFTHQENEALLLKAEIMASLDRKKEASELLDKLNYDSNEEVVNAIKVIKLRHFNGELSSIDQDKLSPPWKVKVQGYVGIAKMGQLEESAVSFLATGPKSISIVATQLYPDIDEGDALNRASTLLTRINKKCDKLIIFNSETKHYELSFNSMIDFEGDK